MTNLGKCRFIALFVDKTSAVVLVVANRKYDDEFNKVGTMSKFYKALASRIIDDDELFLKITIREMMCAIGMDLAGKN
ncbi:pseudouridine synthase family protein [Artemisia annua]|uniref:Pseudouridine synthase family protein n=1 Tax=Artemisia annua TaxID=35608 RepID=A0A2U1NTF5_ARTAN|nr:pseudouridine synthase family protein [Artemisia annua]